jgi:cyclic-di-GMP-binding protein
MTETLLAYLQRRWSGKALESDFLFTDRLDRFVAIGLVASVKLQTSQEKATEDQEFLVNSVSNQLLSGLFKPNVMSIGSLISFRKVDMPQQKRTLGVVNRLIVEKDSGRISFGLRMLTDKVMPVRYLKNDGQLSDVPKSALLYKLEDEIDKNFIIMDTFIFKDGDSIQLFVNQEQFPIILKNRKNIALGYWQFECLRISERSY